MGVLILCIAKAELIHLRLFISALFIDAVSKQESINPTGRMISD
jgi:hypothetical protein